MSIVSTEYFFIHGVYFVQEQAEKQSILSIVSINSIAFAHELNTKYGKVAQLFRCNEQETGDY